MAEIKLKCETYDDAILILNNEITRLKSLQEQKYEFNHEERILSMMRALTVLRNARPKPPKEQEDDGSDGVSDSVQGDDREDTESSSP